MEHVAELGGIVTGFHVTGQCIDCMCGKKLLKIDKTSRNILCQKTVFGKDGLSRKLIADDDRIYIYDFCTLYVLGQKDYELLGKWRLGNDLSSDICGMTVDDETIYCSIRNGKVITLDKQSYRQKEFTVSGSSMWSLQTYGLYLIGGTVEGELLLLDKRTLSIEKNLVLGKKNIGSLHIDGEALYAAGHDGKLYKITCQISYSSNFILSIPKILREERYMKLFSIYALPDSFNGVLITFIFSNVSLSQKAISEQG